MLKSKAAMYRRAKIPAEGLFCNYPHRECMQNRLENYEYCLRHILEDKNSPFKQCNYMNKNGKRCPWAAPKADKKEGYCLEHSKRATSQRHKSSRKRRPKETPETLLESIEHYNSKSEARQRDPRRARFGNDNYVNRLIEYASSSDSENEQTLVDQAWRGDPDSDAESVDSEQEDPLKHAGIYTAEEVTQITRDKLIRLQSLYIEQFKRLQHVMKEKRRKYLHSVRLERERLGSIHAAKEDPLSRERYEKLLAMKRYHKRFGKEALLYRQSKERRIAYTEANNYRPPAYPRCIFTRKTIRCTSRSVPLSKYCLHHVLRDPHQVLYKACGCGSKRCTRPVTSTSIIKPPMCSFHTKLSAPAQRRYPLRQESHDDSKDIDVVGEFDLKVDGLGDLEAGTLGLDVSMGVDLTLELSQELQVKEEVVGLNSLLGNGDLDEEDLTKKT